MWRRKMWSWKMWRCKIWRCKVRRIMCTCKMWRRISAFLCKRILCSGALASEIEEQICKRKSTSKEEDRKRKRRKKRERKGKGQEERVYLWSGPWQLPAPFRYHHIMMPILHSHSLLCAFGSHMGPGDIWALDCIERSSLCSNYLTRLFARFMSNK